MSGKSMMTHQVQMVQHCPTSVLLLSSLLLDDDGPNTFLKLKNSEIPIFNTSQLVKILNTVSMNE